MTRQSPLSLVTPAPVPPARPPFATRPGHAHAPGATVRPDGVNFSLFSQAATGVELLLFDSADATEPVQTIRFDDSTNRSFHFWHVFVEGAGAGLHYAYRVHGPDAPEDGHRFDPAKPVIDPYARGIATALWDRAAACGEGDTTATSLRGVVIDPDGYDWAGDRPLRRPMDETIVYELHVGGFTRHPSSGVAAPGTFRGVIEKIPYLKALGVTAVELLPVFQFDDTERWEFEGRQLTNYWGYSTIGYFAPHSGYCTAAGEGAHLDEFRDMVKALHAAGMEVILDVVYNHTDEGNQHGPTQSFRGIDNATYYHLAPDRRYYFDYTGCGNTVNCNHPIPAKLITDSLKFWANEMHVDGFRFDEGSVLSRGCDGAPMRYPPVLWSIELDDALAESKVIAEAWDAAGLYQVGHFPGFRWGEWNGLYRDDLRRFVKGDPGLVGALADRLSGSAGLYQRSGHLPVNSVNFVTAHDGFTLADLVAYDGKHNHANGEGNRDGVDDNMSWNCGAEGPVSDPDVAALRDRQIRNFAALLMLSQGVPMIVMGDEVRRSQGGNNNAWCQDNETAWFDWRLVQENADLFRFWQHMIAFRKAHPAIHRNRYFTGATTERGQPEIRWHGTELDAPGWDDPTARALGMTLGGFGDDPDIHVMTSMHWEPLSMAIPPLPGRRWLRVVDTGQASPEDIRAPGEEAPVPEPRYAVQPRSTIVLISAPA